MSDKFHENLKQARINSGMTQAEIAEKIGVAKSTYSLYESGRREPDVQKIKQLASALNMTGDELLGIESQMEVYKEYLALRKKVGAERLVTYMKLLEKLNDES